MTFGFAGAGAVGCHYGARLAQAGFDVTLLARGEHLQALQSKGLVHESEGEERLIRIRATDNAAKLEECDVVFLSCKMTALDDMLALLRGCLREGTLLVTLQNGVEAPERVAQVFVKHALLAGTAFIGARLESPGHVIHSAAGGIRLAKWQSGPGEIHTEALLDALSDARVPARMEPDARLMLWRKLLWNVGFNAITALTCCYARDVAAKPETLTIVHEAMRETVKLAQAEGIPLTDEDIDKHIRVTLEMGPVKTSMWQDIEAGRSTEVDFINGFVARRSSEHGFDAPVNRMLTALVHAREDAGCH